MLNLLKNLFRRTPTVALGDKSVEAMAERIKASNDPQLQLLKEVAPFLGEIQRAAPEGDGKAEFLPDMTEQEVLDYERNERLGWKNFKLPWQG